MGPVAVTALTIPTRLIPQPGVPSRLEQRLLQIAHNLAQPGGDKLRALRPWSRVDSWRHDPQSRLGSRPVQRAQEMLAEWMDEAGD